MLFDWEGCCDQGHTVTAGCKQSCHTTRVCPAQSLPLGQSLLFLDPQVQQQSAQLWEERPGHSEEPQCPGGGEGLAAQAGEEADVGVRWKSGSCLLLSPLALGGRE